MKKILKFLRSMKFGIIVMVILVVLCIFGSLITQGKADSYYETNYPSFATIILALNLDNLYKSWYFVTLLVLLCLNLSLCSIVRMKTLLIGEDEASSLASKMKDVNYLDEKGIEILKEHLKKKHCKELVYGDTTVYRKNSFGRFGSFITHLSILLTVIFAAVALYLPVVTDQTCYPGSSLTMDDGTIIKVNSFRIEDSNGRLDYTSNIQIIGANGKACPATDISVNHPLTFQNYKVYQQTYGTAGSVTVTDHTNGATEDFVLDDVCFLSADNLNGIMFNALYPGFVENEDGTVTLITSTSGSYPDPVYSLQVIEDGAYTPYFAFPGDSIDIGNLTFTFNDPLEYPGLRIKYTPMSVNAHLIAAFVLMIIGLYITFFLPPTLVKVDSEGYTVCGPKPESMRLELEELTIDYRKEVKEKEE